MTRPGTQLDWPFGPKANWPRRIVSFFKDKPFFAAFIWSSAIYLAITAVFKIYFQFPDDSLVCLLFNGLVFTHTPSEYNLMINALAACPIKELYLLWPNIQWYALFFVATQFLALWATLAAFQLSPFTFFKTSLFILGFAVVLIHQFGELEWTRTASFAAIGGFMLLAALWSREDKKHFIPSLVMAFCLLILSALIRFPTLPLMALVAIPALLYWAPKGKNRTVCGSVIGTLILTGLLSVGSTWFQQVYYDQNPAWGDSLRLLEAHRGLLSYRNPVYNETTKPIFDSIGWTANDLDLFENSYRLDPSLCNIGKFEKLNAYFTRFGLNKNFNDSIPGVLSNPYTMLSLLFLLVLFFFVPKKELWFAIVTSVWTWLVILFCLWSMKIPERIFLPCLFLQNCLVLSVIAPTSWIKGETNYRFQGGFHWAIVALVFLLLGSGWMLRLQYSKNHYWMAREIELKEIIKKINPQDDQLFITWTTVFPYQEIGAFEDRHFLEHFNVLAMTWFEWTPTSQAMLDRFGIKDFSRDIVDNPAVRLICAPVQFSLYQIHMNEKYNLKVIPQVLLMTDQFPVIAVRSTGNDGPHLRSIDRKRHDNKS